MEDDARLMRRVRGRDAEAFEALYDRHHPLVYAIAIRLTRRVATAEDITQAVFLKIWAAPETYRNGNFEAWIARVTRNKCIDVLRSKSRGTLPLTDYADDQVVEDAAFARLDAASVRSALGRISEEQRVLIEMAFFDGLTQERIAERTDVPLGTIKTRIRTGLQRLRQMLEDAGRA